MFEGGGGGSERMQSDTSQLTAGAVEAGNTAETLDGMLKGLMGRLEPLMSEWLGQAGMSFQKVREEFDLEMKRLNNALRSIGDDMGLSSADYEATDDQLRQTLDQVGASDGTVTRLLAGLEG